MQCPGTANISLEQPRSLTERNPRVAHCAGRLDLTEISKWTVLTWLAAIDSPSRAGGHTPAPPILLMVLSGGIRFLASY